MTGDLIVAGIESLTKRISIKNWIAGSGQNWLNVKAINAVTLPIIGINSFGRNLRIKRNSFALPPLGETISISRIGIGRNNVDRNGRRKG